MENQTDEILNWCGQVLGPVEIVDDHSRAHAGQRAGVLRLHTPSGFAYVKIHQDPAHWENEIHGYERWAPAFGDFAARLLAVRSEPPLALVISEIPGKTMEAVQLSGPQKRAAWRSAGSALAAFHDQAVGEYFGPSRRDGTSAGALIADAREYVTKDLMNWLERGQRGGFLSKEELAVVSAARDLIPAYTGARPLPCHHDYCPANWLVSEDGRWAGVIDFEFSCWDVRAADFTRYPEWEWMSQPDLVDAFFDGYGRSFTFAEEQQRLVAHVQYALAAIVWGMESSYFDFAGEGRQALKRLGEVLG